MVSAWATANRIALGQVVVDKSNELTAIGMAFNQTTLQEKQPVEVRYDILSKKLTARRLWLQHTANTLTLWRHRNQQTRITPPVGR